jgi:hypothetical protein
MRLAGSVICILCLIPPCSTETSDDDSGTASMCSSITPQTPCPHIPLLGHRAGLTCRQALMCAGDPRFEHASASSVCCARHASSAAPLGPGRPHARLRACRLKTTATLTSIPPNDAVQHSSGSCERCYFMRIAPRFDVPTTRYFSTAYLVHSYINTRSPESTLTSRMYSHVFINGTNQFADGRHLPRTWYRDSYLIS